MTHDEVRKLWTFQPGDDVYTCPKCDWSVTVEQWSTTNFDRLKPIFENNHEHLDHLEKELSYHLETEHLSKGNIMKNEITIKLIKKDDHYEWIGLTPEGKTYMWGAAYDDPFDMIDTIKTAIFEEMWDSGWRKMSEKQEGK